MRHIGLFLLALWLITDAVLDLAKIHFPYEKLVMPALALSSGIVLLSSAIKSRLADIGLLLLSIWLILRSCIALFNISFPYSSMVLAILAIASGLFIIIRK